ncbi:DNA-binding LacI/PurR family transcriptional regulator [Arthrobacter pigmenti]|uniref:DNA-binding LacI/PurR family transcriptional regulator n=1 Tax=Arthrobacter pigmenti TaxID=271432 RepID=A0A846RNA0_9MICC|nr:DNA-binding LacI/PurR family transcriptional regulator [Arthrobacter pigmenti]
MLGEERHEKILRELELRGTLKVNDFAARTGLSGMTIRRDLAHLADQGLLKRVHGGAVPAGIERAGAAAGRRARPVATLGLIVPTSGYYFPAVIRGAEAAARVHNARLVLGVSNYSVEEESRQLERLVANGVDGILLASSGSTDDGSPTLELLSRLGVPVVLVERSGRAELAGASLESVMSDHSYGAELAVRHLASLGHNRIGLAVATSPTAPWLREGHGRAVQRLGLEPDAPVIEFTRAGPGIGNNRDVLRAFLDDCVASDTRAVLVLPDEEAIALVGIAQESGLEVPGDLSIVAYDDEVAELAGVPLTAVAPPKRDVGYSAVTMCMERLSHRGSGAASHVLRSVNLAPSLIVRESTGAAHTSAVTIDG